MTLRPEHKAASPPRPRKPRERDDAAYERATGQHPILPEQIHPNVMFICHRLGEEGHTALVVGGAVRDMLQGRHPKDFDLVTSARPEAVRGLFRNARIIGRRFRLVELRFPRMAVEVSTFRGEPRTTAKGMIRRDNTYGTPKEDAFRRDFTINALSFDPLSMTLYDYVGGMRDLERRVIRTIKPPAESFREDPVRMMRAVRFKVRLDFGFDPGCETTIRKLAPRLGDVVRHRLAEEMQRFLTRSNAVPSYTEFDRLGLLKPLLELEPYAWFFAPEALAGPLPLLRPYLECLDRWFARGGEPIPPTVALLGLLLTLARPEHRGALAGPGRAGRITGTLANRLPAFLSDWGLLKGQVEPALAILSAVRHLRQACDGNDKRTKAKARQHGAPPTGTREAWLLLAVLQDVLELPDSWLELGLQQLHELPDLPILDHPRPSRRRVTQAAPEATEALEDLLDDMSATPAPTRHKRLPRPTRHH